MWAPWFQRTRIPHVSIPISSTTSRYPRLAHPISLWWTFRPQTTAAASHHTENINVQHSRFLAEAPAQASWKGSNNSLDGVVNGEGDDVDSLTPGKGMHSY